MNTKPTSNTKAFNPLFILAALSAAFLLIDILFLVFIANQAKTTQLLKQELITLEDQNRIITSANEIYDTYLHEIDVISDVFPSEETIPMFIQDLEGLLRSTSDEYTFKFTSVNPLKEADLLYLPMVLTLKTDLGRFLDLLSKLESLTHMTHITSINAKTPTNFSNTSEVQIGIKVYVQNPFSSK